MMQVLFHIPFLGWPVYGYGLMMVIGFYVGIQLCMYLAKRCGLNPDTLMNAGLLALITGIIGARASHVLENLGEYTDSSRSIFANLKAAANISSGGLTYYGGFLLAFPVLVVYAVKKQIPLRLGMDIIAPGLMVGLGFGRIGCLLNGCCYGAVCNDSWAPTMTFPYNSIAYQDQFIRGQISPPADLLAPTNRPPLMTWDELKPDPSLRALAVGQRSLSLIPAQVYSAITAFLIAFTCVAFFTVPHKAGHVFAGMMIVEGFERYILELLRAEPAVAHLGKYGLSLSMILGLGLTMLGGVLWMIFSRLRREAIESPLFVPQSAFA